MCFAAAKRDWAPAGREMDDSTEKDHGGWRSRLLARPETAPPRSAKPEIQSHVLSEVEWIEILNRFEMLMIRMAETATRRLLLQSRSGVPRRLTAVANMQNKPNHTICGLLVWRKCYIWSASEQEEKANPICHRWARCPFTTPRRRSHSGTSGGLMLPEMVGGRWPGAKNKPNFGNAECDVTLFDIAS
jgi:hypothetical protein